MRTSPECFPTASVQSEERQLRSACYFPPDAEERQYHRRDVYNTYNMGLGMVLALDPADVDKTMEALKAAGETAYVVGTCETGEKGVTIC